PAFVPEGNVSKVIVTSSVLGAHTAPFEIVQRNTYVVPAVPVNVVAGSASSAKEPAPSPLTTLHSPVPTTGVLAASVADVPHTLWSGPASAMVGVLRSNVISTSSELAAQTPFDIVHRSVYVVPPTPENVVEGFVGSARIPPAPFTIVHIPVPTPGVLPARVAGPQTV